MYSTRTFIRLTGTTAKSLRHYEKVGLIAPVRTAAGYRRFSPADMRRIHQVLALKSLDLSLDMIKQLLDGTTLELSSHRAWLATERDRLSRAIDVLSGVPAESASAAAFQHFVADCAWERADAMFQRYATTTPVVAARVCQSKLDAFRELATALEINPIDERTRALAVAFRGTFDPDSGAAVKRRAAWPSGMRRYIASLYDASPETWERVLAFIETLLPAAQAGDRQKVKV